MSLTEMSRWEDLKQLGGIDQEEFSKKERVKNEFSFSYALFLCLDFVCCSAKRYNAPTPWN